MSKTLIVAMALSLVLVSGGLFSAQADCGLNPCGWHLPSLCSLNLNPCNWHWPSCFSCSQKKDMDKPADSYDQNRDTGKY
ncbi:MAG: hypothetical protein ABSF90_25235 [Syntrophobacteraceae bacterium]|jgi:hypothetical protein